MDYNKGNRGSFGGSLFVLFAIGVVALILLTIISFMLNPPSVEGAQKLWMSNPQGTWCYLNSWILNPFTCEWIQGPWMLFFIYF